MSKRPRSATVFGIFSVRYDQGLGPLASCVDDYPGWARRWACTLRGAQRAPEQAREVLAAADRIRWLPSREWNVALLEAHAALMSGDRRRAVAQAKRALGMMTVERDTMLGPTNMVAAATVLACGW